MPIITLAANPPKARHQRADLRRTILLLALAGAALLSGLMVYGGRPGPHPTLMPWAGLWAAMPTVHGLPPWWPSFAHTVGFGLLTAAAMPGSSPRRHAACLAWGTVNALFELGQHPRLAHHLADALGGAGVWPRAIDLPAYWIHGTFDPTDLAACALGSVAAMVALLAIDRSTRERTT